LSSHARLIKGMNLKSLVEIGGAPLAGLADAHGHFCSAHHFQRNIGVYIESSAFKIDEKSGERRDGPLVGQEWAAPMIFRIDLDGA
jgi:hypothetical protein